PRSARGDRHGRGDQPRLPGDPVAGPERPEGAHREGADRSIRAYRRRQGDRRLMPRRAVLAMAMAALAAGVPLAVVRAAQEPPPERTPSFPSQASAITVDAVVLDRSGAPIRGLTRDDFTILEDGR